MNSLLEEIRTAIYTVWNRRWLALAVAWGVCLLGWLVLAMVPNSYESRARIFVQLDDALAEQIGIGVGDRKRAIERVRQTLTTTVNLEKVIKSTRIGEEVTSPRQMDAAVLALSKNVWVVSTEDNLFEIGAISKDSSLSDAENAKLARDVVQKLIDLFREGNLAGGRGEMTESVAFVSQQLAEREKALQAAEQKRLAFESAHPEMAQGGAGMIQRLEASRTELRGVEADLAAAQSALAATNGQLAGTPATLAGTGGARGSLAQAQSDLASMRARGFTDNHPDVIALKNQITALRTSALGDTGIGGTPNPAYTSLQSIKIEKQSSVSALQARRVALQADIAGASARNIANPELASQAQSISRDYDVLKAQYDKLLQDREELRLRGQVETERSAVRMQVVDPPSTPRAPYAPNRPLLLAAILVLGLGAGAGVAFALGHLRSSYSTTAKLERSTGLPVLGAISLVLTDAAREARARSNKHFFAISAALCGLFLLLLVVEFIQVRMVA